jgi:GT2 family glycosyltransferase
LETEKGAGPARNAGARIAAAPALAFIDSDCRPSAEWLHHGLLGLRDHPIVGGPVIIVPQDPNDATPEEAFDVVFGFNALQFLKEHGFIGSGNLFVRREVFERVGGFRSGVSEDVEWGRRATATGYTLTHVVGAVVAHPARRGWESLVQKWDKHTRETYLLVRERRFGKLRWILQSGLVLASPFLHVGKVLSCPHLTSWRDRRGAIRVLFKIRGHRFVQSYRTMRTIERDAATAMPLSPVAARPDSSHE